MIHTRPYVLGVGVWGWGPKASGPAPQRYSFLLPPRSPRAAGREEKGGNLLSSLNAAIESQNYIEIKLWQING